MSAEHTLHNLHRDGLEALETRLLGTGREVCALIERAIGALVRRDADAAAAVIAADDEIDRRYVAAQDDALTMIALQAPVASRLRTVAALLHLNVHIERMGDLAVNIAKSIDKPGSVEPDAGLMDDLARMGEAAMHLAHVALDAFGERDLAAVRGLPALDDPVDELNRDVFRRLVRIAADDPARLDWAMRMVLVARYLERLGDHAVDIGEQAIFAVTGQTVELSSNSPV